MNTRRECYTDCWCYVCETEARQELYLDGRLDAIGRQSAFTHVCPDCGDKRCPRAMFHRYACSGSVDMDLLDQMTTPALQGTQ